MSQIEFTTGEIRPIECVKEAWDAIKADYWPLLAISIVGALIGAVSLYVLIGAMICGIFKSYLRVIDGGKSDFEDLKAGLKYFRTSLLTTVLFVLPIVAYMLGLFVTLYLPLLTRAVGGQIADGSDLLAEFGVALGVEIVIALIMVCIHTLLIFAFPLIVDKDLSSWDAIRLSARAAMRNAGGIGGLLAVNLVLVIVGYLACCIGLYLVIPIITASGLVAYRKVFPGPVMRSDSPPPPTAYEIN